MVCIQIRLTEEQAKTLKKLASTRHLSVAELIRQPVDSIIQSNAVLDIEKRRKRAINAAGKFKSGKRDISKEHDKYLEEAFSE
jgi:hypothetical protein